MEFCGHNPSVGKKEFMVDGFLANLGVGRVSRFRSSLLATSLLYCLAPGSRLQHSDSKSKACLCEVSMMSRLVHVDCQKRFPMYRAIFMYQVAGFGRGSANHKDLERLPLDWEGEKIFHCKSYNSFFPATSVFVT